MTEVHPHNLKQNNTTSEPDSPAIAENAEVDMYGLSVKAAVDEMRRRLGPDCCSGERHPCDDMWATLYISMDGSSLSCIPDFELMEPFRIMWSNPSLEGTRMLLSNRHCSRLEEGLARQSKPKQVPIESQVSPYRLKDRVLQEDLILLIEPHIQTSHIPPTPMATQKSSLLSALQMATESSFAQGRLHRSSIISASLRSP